MNITITKLTPQDIHVQFPKIGHVSLRKFSPDFDHGLYRERPWHVTTFGRNFATVEECLLYLQLAEETYDDEPDEEGEWKGTCHGEMTHSFLSLEADLDDCPF